MRRVAVAGFAGLVALAACGSKERPPVVARKDAGSGIDAAPLELAPLALGMDNLASYAWRTRAGHPAFRAARVAEGLEDWVTVVTKCKAALAVDPGHLEAAWLLAAGLGTLGKVDEILAPLQLAAAGDFGKWGPASLELPALQGFLATPTGAAWRVRVETDRATYIAALARSVVIAAAGDLFAFDAEGSRWYRLTRTHGATIGALAIPDARLVAYATRSRVKTGAKQETRLAVGVVSFARGHTSRPVDLGIAGPITLSKGAKGISIGTPMAPAWRLLIDGKLDKAPSKTRPLGPWLEIAGKTTVFHRPKLVDVTADWDDHRLASGFRIGKSNRVVSPPSPALVDGNTLVWSPDRAHVAFVAQLVDECTPQVPNAATFVADTTTGQLQEIERGIGGLAIEWASDRKLVVAGDKGVALVDLDGTRVSLVGASGLVTPRRVPHCAVPAEPTPPDPEPEPELEPEAAVGDEATDAGVR